MLTDRSFSSVYISFKNRFASMRMVFIATYSSNFSFPKFNNTGNISLLTKSDTDYLRDSDLGPLTQQFCQLKDWYRRIERLSVKNSQDSLERSSWRRGSQLSQCPGYQNELSMQGQFYSPGTLSAQRVTRQPLLESSKAVMKALMVDPMTATSVSLVGSTLTVRVFEMMQAQPQERLSSEAPCPQLWKIFLSLMLWYSRRRPSSRQVYKVAQAPMTFWGSISGKLILLVLFRLAICRVGEIITNHVTMTILISTCTCSQLLSPQSKQGSYNIQLIDTMDTARLTKAYESKIIDLTKELEQAKASSDKIKAQHLKLSESYQKNNKTLQQKIQEVRNLQDKCTDLEQKLEQQQIELLESNTHRKQMADGIINSSTRLREKKMHASTFMRNWDAIREDSIGETVKELTRELNSQNQTIKELRGSISAVNKELLTSTVQYQKKISELTAQNKGLLASIEQYRQAALSLDTLSATQSYTLVAENLLLEEKLRLAVEKLKAFDQKQSTQENQPSETPNKYACDESSTNYEDLDEIVKVVRENKSLKRDLQEMQYRYELLIEEFPDYVNKGEEIEDFMSKYTRLNKLETECEEKRILAEAQEEQIVSLQQSLNDATEQMEGMKKQMLSNHTFFRNLSQKILSYLEDNDPHFNRFGPEIFALDDKQLTYLQQGNFPQAANNSGHSYQALKEGIQKGMALKYQRQNKQLSSKLEAYARRSAALEQVISNLSARLEENKESMMAEQNQDKFMEILTKVQNERNAYLLQCKEKEAKIIELMTKLTHMGEQTTPTLIHEVHYPVSSNEFPIHTVYQYSQAQTILQDKIKEMRNDFDNERKLWDAEVKEKQEAMAEVISRLMAQLARKEIEVVRLTEKQTETGLRIQQLTNKISYKDKPQFSEAGSFMDVEDNHITAEDNNASTNSLTNEAIDDLSKVLTGHVTLLKNVLSSYEELRSRYAKLEEQVLEGPVENKKGDQESPLNEDVKSLEIRLRESDHNCMALEDKLQQNEEEMRSLKEQYEKESSSQKKIIEELKAQLKTQLDSEANQADQQMVDCQQKGGCTEQVEYLLQLLAEKKNQNALLRKKLKSARKLPARNPQEGQEQKIRSPEIEELEKLVEDGRLARVLDGAIERLQESRKGDGDAN